MEADHKEFQEKNVADGQEAEATMNTGSAGSSASIPTNSTSSWQDITKENFFTQEQHKDWDGVVGFLHPFWLVAVPSIGADILLYLLYFADLE